MKIIPLSEGTFTVDATKQFIPFNTNSDRIQDRPAGSLLVEVQPFAVITSKDIIVIDTGLGFTMPDGVLQIHHNLIANGINPLDVTKVLMSHLHKDHAGGVAKEDTLLEKQFLSFPNATYIVNKQELEIAVSKLSRSYVSEDVALLTTSDNVLLVESEGMIDDMIQYAWTGGHSPWHQVFWIRENGETVFFGGDIAPQLIQLKTRFINKYDFDGKLAADLRTKWLQQGKEEGWTFLFYHDVKTPFQKSAK